MTRSQHPLSTWSTWALYAGLFATPLTLGGITPGRLDTVRDLWAHAVLCILAGATAVGALLSGQPVIRWRRSCWTVVALLLAYVASACVTSYPRGTLAELMRLIDYIALYWLIRALLRAPDRLLMGAASFALGAAAAAGVGVQEYLVTGVSGDWTWRTFGPFFNPNLLAAAVLVAIPLWVALARIRKLPMMQAGTILALVICLLALCMTFSKGGYLALFGALIAGAILAPDPAKGGAWKPVALGVGLVVVGALVALALPQIRARIALAFGPQSNSVMHRYYTWLGTWHMALARPLLGWGPGSFAAVYPKFAIVGHTHLAHQTYLQIAAETGFVGGAALLGFMGTQLAAGLKASRKLAGNPRVIAVAATAGMVGFALHNVVDYGWHVTATGMAFWVLAGIVAAASDPEATPAEPDRKAKRKHQDAGPPVAWTKVGLAVLLAVAAIVPAGVALKAEALADAGQLTDAMRLDPLNDKYVRQAALLAQSRAARGRDDLYERALAYWDRVEKIRPTHPGTPYNRGMIFRDVGKPTEAIAALRRSRELAPTWPKAIIAQAQLHDELGEKDQALAAYGRVNELSESPLLLYRAIDTDLDPSFAWAWLAIADSLPESDALPLYDRSGRYLRRLLAANRAAEARLRMSGDWEYRQSPDVVRLCQEAARRHLVFDDPGPRLRAALLLVDAGSSDLAEKLFVSEGDPVLGPNVAGELLEAWSLYVAASHRRAQARTKPDLESAHRLMAAAGARIDALLQTHSGEFDRLRDGAHGWTDAEYGALNQAVLAGKSADEAMNTE